MKKINLSKLSLNQMTVSKLQDAQIKSVKGGGDSSVVTSTATGWRQCGASEYYTVRCP